MLIASFSCRLYSNIAKESRKKRKENESEIIYTNKKEV